MNFDNTELFDGEVRPAVLHLIQLCRQHDLPLVLAIGISREASAENRIVGDTFQTCRITTGNIQAMSSNMLAAGMMLNDDLARVVRNAIIGNIMQIMTATVAGKGDDDVLEITRVIAAYSVMWRVLNQAGVASRPANSTFGRVSPDETVEMGGIISPEHMRRIYDMISKLDGGDVAEERKSDDVNMSQDLADQLRALLDDDGEDK